MEYPQLKDVIETFNNYKSLSEKAINQIAEGDLHKQLDDQSNSIAIIMQHISGNMLSRWSDFLTTDGEKEWRNRDMEFEQQLLTKSKLLEAWKDGWDCLFNALAGLSQSDMKNIVFIRNEPHTVWQAILRQLTHYAYHTGQIVFLAKHFSGTNWSHLSMPKAKK